MMNSRERVIRAVEFEGPGRVPNGCHWLPGTFERYGKRLMDLFDRFPNDFGEPFFPSYISKHRMVAKELYRKEVYRDPFGCVWRNIKLGLLGQVIKHPLADWRNLETYQLPGLSEIMNFDAVEKIIHSSRHDKYILGDVGNFFEMIQWLRGFENIFIDLLIERKELNTLMSRLMELKLRFIKRWLELEVDGINFSDDWGTMDGLMINPELWRRVFKTPYQRMFSVVHKAGKHVFFHSDGNILDIIPDFIEIGVDALNIQVALMGVDLLSERFGGKICILGGVDEQYLLPFGGTDEVKEHIKHMIRGLACFDGGLISWGVILPDVPLANAEAMLEAFAKFGQYPLML